jgi:IS5 family transposase
MPIVRKLPSPAIPEPTPRKRTREETIASLLAGGMTLEEIEEEECRAAALKAAAQVRARYWLKSSSSAAKPAAPVAPAPTAATPAAATPDPAPSTKLRYRVRSWKHSTQALRQRASLTLWIEQETIQAWYGNIRQGKLGHPTTYTDVAVLSLLTLREVFHLPLRQTQGFAQSLFVLLGTDLVVPDYTTLSRRGADLDVPLPGRAAGEGVHVVIDSSGLKVYGEGEWKTRQHGISKRRTWRKMHLAIDEGSGEILAVITSERSVGDCEKLGELLEQIAETIEQVSADGAYDTIECHQAIEARAAKAAIPPRSNAVESGMGDWDARDAAVRRIEEVGRAQWKKEVNYHRRSLAETMMFRVKRTFGARLAGRRIERQGTEVRIRCAALNRMTALGMPQSYVVAAA